MKNTLFILLGLFIGAALVSAVWMLQPEYELNVQQSDFPQITFPRELNHENGALDPVFTKEEQNEIRSGAIEPFIHGLETDGYTVIAIEVRDDKNQEGVVDFDAILLQDNRFIIHYGGAGAYQNEDGTYQYMPGPGPGYRG